MCDTLCIVILDCDSKFWYRGSRACKKDKTKQNKTKKKKRAWHFAFLSKGPETNFFFFLPNLGEKIWQYKCVHDKVYFNVLFGSKYS